MMMCRSGGWFNSEVKDEAGMKNIKIKNKYILISVLAAFFVASLISCSSDNDSEVEKKKGGMAFFSAANPGPWTEQAVDHEAEITITRIDNRKIIDVNIPFAQQKEQRHYVEAIVIMDINRNELQKKSFVKGRGTEKGAKFDFPENYDSPVYVVMKCNLHDMWEKLVDWSE